MEEQPEHGSTSSSFGTGASSSNTSPALEEDAHGGRFPHHNQFRNPELDEQRIGFSYQANVRVFDNDVSAAVGEDTWSCTVVLLTFWFFVSMTLILGVYGPVEVQLGPNSSLLLQPNAIFVQSIKMEELNKSKPGPTLFGFYDSPPLDVVKIWFETHKVSVPTDSYKDWMYYLNAGSQINISYTVHSPNSSIFLIIAQGSEGLTQWLDNPSYPNTTLSWNVIHGSGVISQDTVMSSSYYVSVGNLNSEDVEVHLHLGIKATLYNTSEAYYKCNLTQGPCSMEVLFPNGNAAVLTSPGRDEAAFGYGLYVKLSYGPRWVTYIVGIGGLTVLMLFAFNFLNKFQCARNQTGGHYEERRSEREPLISHKDDDLSSWGSSYDSASNGEEDFEDHLPVGSLEGKSLGDGEYSNNTRRLCAICFDAPRDCFFLPCGHCVACFACGTRIADADGTCPICRRKMKKVRKIFTV